MDTMHLSTMEVLILYVICGVITFGLIRLAKYQLSNKSVPYERRKQGKDIFAYSKRNFGFGLVISILVVLFTFNWTTSEKVISSQEYSWNEEDIISIDPPRTRSIINKTRPPKIWHIEPTPEYIEEEPFTFVDMEIDEEFSFDLDPIDNENLEKGDPILPPPEEDGPDEIVTFSEQMPRFPGCEHLDLTIREKEDCSKGQLLKFIYDNIKYPSVAKENNIEGMCVIRFVVEKNGHISSVEIMRDIGGGCGMEAKRVVELMNEQNHKWIAGRQRGRAVRVQYNLPVRFKLER